VPKKLRRHVYRTFLDKFELVTGDIEGGLRSQLDYDQIVTVAHRGQLQTNKSCCKQIKVAANK
jgi:hypothetical protein